MQANGYAYNALMMSSPASFEALALFGKARLIAIAVASFVVVMLFKLSGSSFASMTGTLGAGLEGTGSAAANDMMSPVGNVAYARGAAEAKGYQTAAAAAGPAFFDGVADSSAHRAAATSSEGSTFGRSATGAGQVSGASAAKATLGTQRGQTVTGAPSRKSASDVAGDVAFTDAMMGGAKASEFGRTSKDLVDKGLAPTADAAGRRVATSAAISQLHAPKATSGFDTDLARRNTDVEAAKRTARSDAAAGMASHEGLTVEESEFRKAVRTEAYEQGAARPLDTPGAIDQVAAAGEQNTHGYMAEAKARQEVGRQTGRTGNEVAESNARAGILNAAASARVLQLVGQQTGQSEYGAAVGTQSSFTAEVTPGSELYDSLAPEQQKVVDANGAAVLSGFVGESGLVNATVSSQNDAVDSAAYRFDESDVVDSSTTKAVGPSVRGSAAFGLDTQADNSVNLDALRSMDDAERQLEYTNFDAQVSAAFSSRMGQTESAGRGGTVFGGIGKAGGGVGQGQSDTGKPPQSGSPGPAGKRSGGMRRLAGVTGGASMSANHQRSVQAAEGASRHRTWISDRTEQWLAQDEMLNLGYSNGELLGAPPEGMTHEEHVQALRTELEEEYVRDVDVYVDQATTHAAELTDREDHTRIDADMRASDERGLTTRPRRIR